ncbi:hypothetical protein HDE_00162 [Halotydeus destructor]|nr:hypothetical protein HDE_00162 [Halotydeus destructor]
MLTTVTCKTYVILRNGEFMSWEAADLGCKQLGGHLARPTSMAETAFLTTINKTPFWIDAKKAGASYVWSDGSGMRHTDWDTSNASCSSDGCHIRIKPSGKWYVTLLVDSHSAICELPMYRFDSGAPINHTVDDTLHNLVSNSTTHDLVLKSMTTGKLDRSEMEAFKLEHQEYVRKSMLQLQKVIQGYHLNVSFEQVFPEHSQQSQENLRQLSCSIELESMTIKMDKMESRLNETISNSMVAAMLIESAMSEFEQHYQDYGRQLALNTSRQLRNLSLALHKDRAKMYVVSSASLMYLEAKEYCKINGGHVVRLQDEYEAEYIASQVTNQSYWIDAIKNGTKYTWAGKSEIDYTNWKSNQAGCTSETCAIFVEKEDQTWVAVDYGAGGRKMAVCEKDNRMLASRYHEVSPNDFAVLSLIISLVTLAVLHLILVYAHLQMRREMKRLSMRNTRVAYQRDADTCVLSQQNNNLVNLYEPIA